VRASCSLKDPLRGQVEGDDLFVERVSPPRTRSSRGDLWLFQMSRLELGCEGALDSACALLLATLVWMTAHWSRPRALLKSSSVTFL
jgi:hypothetical protein